VSSFLIAITNSKITGYGTLLDEDNGRKTRAGDCGGNRLIDISEQPTVSNCTLHSHPDHHHYL
jgi:hypothetical protein